MTVHSDDPFTAAGVITERKPGFRPCVGLILGSGLGPLADRIEDATTATCRAFRRAAFTATPESWCWGRWLGNP